MDLMTPAQIEERFPIVSRSLVYAACKNGDLPHYRLPAKKGARGKYAIKLDDFLKWLEANRVEGVTEDDGELRHIR